MLNLQDLDARFGDRFGCGDELYLDSRSKAASSLALSLTGVFRHTNFGLDLDFIGEDGDESASH